MNKLINIAEAFKPEKIKDVRAGQIFIFSKDKQKTNYKVMRVDRKRNKIWTKIVPLYRPDEIAIDEDTRVVSTK